jgi:hypothetical protein
MVKRMHTKRITAVACALMLSANVMACSEAPNPALDGGVSGAPDSATGPDLSMEMDAAKPADASGASDASFDMSSNLDTGSRDQGHDGADVAFDQGGEPDVTPGAPPNGDPELEPGTGRLTHEGRLQADVVRWEAGPQGGHHIWVSAQLDSSWIEELDDEARQQLRTTYTITHVDGTLLARTSRLGAWRLLDGVWTHVGQYAVLEVRRRPSLMDGEWLELVVEVEHQQGVLFSQVWLVSDCCD